MSSSFPTNEVFFFEPNKTFGDAQKKKISRNKTELFLSSPSLLLRAAAASIFLAPSFLCVWLTALDTLFTMSRLSAADMVRWREQPWTRKNHEHIRWHQNNFNRALALKKKRKNISPRFSRPSFPLPPKNSLSCTQEASRLIFVSVKGAVPRRYEEAVSIFFPPFFSPLFPSKTHLDTNKQP